ncbi:hypothetical protein [Halobellus captivus]|uniref:hypothetical protein n=1 Tax=Halobellus captivus TaxID=2592614 RepID=UPI00119E203E|nr:hypothetical protein [Halobellus captivus]
MIDEIALARTYNPRSYADPADQLDDYRRVKRYVNRHPNAGRTAVGTALDLPPSRVRGWMDGGKPDAVNGVECARKHGWLDIAMADPHTAAFAECVIGVFACGSIDRRWTVAYAPAADRSRYRLWNRLSALGVEPTRRHRSAPTRPTELLPGVDGSVFARCLGAAGAPRGTKNAATTPPLPSWLLETDLESRRRCVELYLLERGTIYEDKETVVLRSRNRSEAYRQSLAHLCRSVTDEEVSVGANVVLSAAAARELRPDADGSPLFEILPTETDSSLSSGGTKRSRSVRGY